MHVCTARSIWMLQESAAAAVIQLESRVLCVQCELSNSVSSQLTVAFSCRLALDGGREAGVGP